MEKHKEWLVRVAYSVTLSFSSEKPVDVDTVVRKVKTNNLSDGDNLVEVDNELIYLISTEPVGE